MILALYVVPNPVTVAACQQVCDIEQVAAGKGIIAGAVAVHVRGSGVVDASQNPEASHSTRRVLLNKANII
jgi:hypothetical protein